jgi:hypothetical protein
MIIARLAERSVRRNDHIENIIKRATVEEEAYSLPIRCYRHGINGRSARVHDDKRVGQDFALSEPIVVRHPDQGAVIHRLDDGP